MTEVIALVRTQTRGRTTGKLVGPFDSLEAAATACAERYAGPDSIDVVMLDLDDVARFVDDVRQQTR